MLKLTLLSSLFLTSLIANADVLPNRALTPGVARAVDVNTLCTTSTPLVRNVPQNVKDTAYTSYGLNGNDRTACPQGYEIDHLISLELGGSNDIKKEIIDSYDEILATCKKYVKLLFLGDPAQLPPVNQPDSKTVQQGAVF